jgi:hypothetical protein
MVFTGHNHFYQRTYPLECTDIDNPIITDYDKDFYHYPDPIFATVGRAGAPSATPTNSPGWFVGDRMSSSLHYMKVDLYTNGSLHATTRYTDNVIFDDFWIIKNGTPPPPTTEKVTLISQGDEWLYNETDPQPPSNPSWNKTGFDDSAWLSGSAPLGFGDSVTYGTVLNDNDGSYYFRKNFTFDPKNDVISARLYVASDDYAQVYLNGILVDDDSGNNHEFAYWNRDVSVPVSALLIGDNTVAVFVYNSPTSSDAYMDLELKATINITEGPNRPPTITSSDTTTAYDGLPYSQIYTASDPENNPMTWSLLSNASWLSIDPDTGELSGTPGLEDVGTSWVNITVTDNQSAFDFHYFILTVDMIIPLHFGWNFVSLPLEISDNDLDLLLQSIDSHYDAVQFYEAFNSNEPWKHYSISKPAHLNDLSSIKKTMGFWVHIVNSNGANLTVSGTNLESIQNITLYKGWNMVSFLSTIPKMKSAATTVLMGPIHILGTDNSHNPSLVRTINEDDLLYPKNGYWLFSPIEQDWALDGGT